MTANLPQRLDLLWRAWHQSDIPTSNITDVCLPPLTDLLRLILDLNFPQYHQTFDWPFCLLLIYFSPPVIFLSRVQPELQLCDSVRTLSPSPVAAKTAELELHRFYLSCSLTEVWCWNRAILSTEYWLHSQQPQMLQITRENKRKMYFVSWIGKTC